MYAFGTPVASISQCVATEAANSRHSNYVQSVCSALIARMSRRGWGGWGGRGWGVWGAEMMWCPGGKSVTGRAPLTPAVGAHVWPCAETHAVARKHSHRWKARSPEYLLTPWDLPIRAWCHQRMLERADGIFPYIPLATTLPSVQPNDPSPFTPSRGDGGGGSSAVTSPRSSLWNTRLTYWWGGSSRRRPTLFRKAFTPAENITAHVI